MYALCTYGHMQANPWLPARVFLVTHEDQFERRRTGCKGEVKSSTTIGMVGYSSQLVTAHVDKYCVVSEAEE